MQLRKKLTNSLLYRFIVVNVFAMALVWLTAYEGWIQAVFIADTTHITAGIAILFLTGFFLATFKATRLNVLCEDDAERKAEFYNVTYNSLVLRGAANLSILNRLAATMLLFGISGTVIGLMIALSQVDPAAASNVALVGPMAATLLHGVSVKLSTTLCGIIGNIWTMANYQLLSTETQQLIARVCEEKHL